MKFFKFILATSLLISIAWAQEPAKDPRDAACLKCHADDKPVQNFWKTTHGVKADSRTPACVSCHGESTAHNADKKVTPDIVFKKGSFAVTDVKTQNASCLSCHNNDAKRNNWMGSAHQINDVACISCHSIHQGHDKVRDRQLQTETCFSCHKEQRAEAHKLSHHPMAEGKVTCSDCHNLHGTPGNKLLKKNTLNETCFTCHAEKRGPFLWQHQSAMENCGSCHAVHGSNIQPLLKARGSMMCDECHNGPHASKGPAGPNMGGIQTGTPLGTSAPSGSYGGRGCIHCHSMIHGSNHPAGAWFNR